MKAYQIYSFNIFNLFVYIDLVDEKKLLNYSIAYLSKFDSSKKNLIIILKRKILKLSITNFEKNKLIKIIENIIVTLEKNNFINDKRYALSKISYLANSGKSKTFIFNYLIKKGIDKYEVQDNFKSYQINNSDWEINSARIFAKKKRLLDTNTSYEKRLAKMARAGFNYEICKKILD